MTNCPHCNAEFSHRPPKSDTILWKCGTWINEPKKLAEQSQRCYIRCLEAEVKRLREDLAEYVDDAFRRWFYRPKEKEQGGS